MLDDPLTMVTAKLCLASCSMTHDHSFPIIQADLYSGMVTRPLDTAETPPSSSPGFTRTRIQLPQGGDYGLSLPAFIPGDKNSVVNIIFQVCKHAELALWQQC